MANLCQKLTVLGPSTFIVRLEFRSVLLVELSCNVLFRDRKICDDLLIELLTNVAQILFAEFDLNETLPFGLIHAADICYCALESFN
jgi:hypothetical protein